MPLHQVGQAISEEDGVVAAPLRKTIIESGSNARGCAGGSGKTIVLAPELSAEFVVEPSREPCPELSPMMQSHPSPASIMLSPSSVSAQPHPELSPLSSMPEPNPELSPFGAGLMPFFDDPNEEFYPWSLASGGAPFPISLASKETKDDTAEQKPLDMDWRVFEFLSPSSSMPSAEHEDPMAEDDLQVEENDSGDADSFDWSVFQLLSKKQEGMSARFGPATNRPSWVFTSAEAEAACKPLFCDREELAFQFMLGDCFKRKVGAYSVVGAKAKFMQTQRELLSAMDGHRRSGGRRVAFLPSRRVAEDD